jgi:acyl-CoA dehydrogenase
MPKISNTEAAALNAGTVGFDGDLFVGNPSLANLVKKYDVKLSSEEQSFMDNQVSQLCAMLDDYEIARDRDMPEHVWEYIKREKFFGMIIPKKYGGLGFSAHGHSMVVTKIASRSGSAAVTVMVPNSLGPGELLNRYGTEDQKNYYLPRLASGDIIPCFGLTGPASGSDAASMRDTGIVIEKDGVLGVRATFKKRYITLAPVAGVVGLAFNLKDPKGLLKGVGHEGITIALLQKNHPGLRIGNRHDPLTAAFMNGTVEGEDVFIPMTDLLGGQTRAGYGWNMLMECLSEGRGISLPALSIAAAKGVSISVGAYARIRKQFKVPIAEMEGVQEGLARIASNAYIMQSAQMLTNAMLNQHEQPAVISAIMKQQMTHRMRTVVNDGMDILGGAGICNGPSNFLANAYSAIPIAITVEGANTLTRSLIQFGQGLTRSHPHLINIIKSIQHGDDMKGFNQALTQIIQHATMNLGRSLSSAVTRSRSTSDRVAYYESQLAKLATNFAFASDLALILGGKLKFAEFLSGRYADVLSNLYLGYATLWYAQKHPLASSTEQKQILDYAMNSILYEIEDAFEGVFQNFPIPGVGLLGRSVVFPFGRNYTKPSDSMTKAAADLITKETSLRKILQENVYIQDTQQIPANQVNRASLLVATLPLAIKVDELYIQLRKQNRQATAEEKKLIDHVEAMREIIIQVDSFIRIGKERSYGEEWTADMRPAYTSSYTTAGATSKATTGMKSSSAAGMQRGYMDKE